MGSISCISGWMWYGLYREREVQEHKKNLKELLSISKKVVFLCDFFGVIPRESAYRDDRYLMLFAKKLAYGVLYGQFGCKNNDSSHFGNGGG